jgi:WD40 repeat protein
MFRTLNPPVLCAGCDWSVSNDLMVSCSLDATLCLWDVGSQKCLRVVRDQMGAEMLSCLFQPANNNMVIVSFICQQQRSDNTLDVACPVPL